MIKKGDIIISSPYADTGIVFSKSVIYIIEHDESGTSGVIINKLLTNLDKKSISKALNTVEKNHNNQIKNDLPIYFGGPVEQEKGIILHSSDYRKNSLTELDKDVLVNIDSHIIEDIIAGIGPIHKMLILGYTAWSPNQLLMEIKRNDWLLPLKSLDKKTIYDLLFVEDYHSRWNTALKLAGINLANYTNSTGSA